MALLNFHHRFRNGNFIQAWCKRAIGDRKLDHAQLLATSPINPLDKVRVPLYVVHGKRDPRVPHDSQYMPLMRKLRGTKIDHKLMVKKKEDHGFRSEKNPIEPYTELEKFFAEHIGSRSAPVANAGARLAQTRAASPSALTMHPFLDFRSGGRKEITTAA